MSISTSLQAIFDYPDMIMGNRDQLTKTVADDYGYSIYTFINANGNPAACIFKGRSKKPCFHYRFKDEDQRQKSVDGWLADYQKSKNAKAEYKAKNKERNIKEGDILRSMWGYDQTSVCFYIVQKLVGKHSAQIVEVGSIKQDNGDMTASEIPNPQNIIGEPMTKRVNNSSIKINCSETARLMEPKIIMGCKIYDASSSTSYA